MMVESISFRGENEGGRATKKEKISERQGGGGHANNLFSFSPDRHIRQHLYRFVDYANTKGGVGNIEKIITIKNQDPFFLFHLSRRHDDIFHAPRVT